MGYRPKIAADPRGFSLLELLVALLVLGVALAVTLPTIGRGTDSIRARAEVARFCAMLRHAREQAITTRRPHAFVVDPAVHRVSIVVGDDEVRQARDLPAEFRVDANPPPALTVRFEPSGVNTGGEFHIVSGTIRYRVTVDALTGRVQNFRL